MHPEVLLGGRYLVGPVIGRGGMGAVHRAQDRRFDRVVAIKRFRTGAGADAAGRLEQEAALLGRLTHPNLVAAFDAGTDEEGEFWLALELVPGPDLGSLLAQRGPLASGQVQRMLGDVADALAFVHAAGVVHRDVKPSNVLLTADPASSTGWHAKLADFGIARLTDRVGPTTSGVVVGTAAYLSPEQVRGEPATGAADVYALGLVTLEALTGSRPFPGTTAESATARLARPPAVPGWITGGWRGLLESMTAIDPAARPTADQVRSAVAHPLPSISPAADAPTAPTDAATQPMEPLQPTRAMTADAGTRLLEPRWGRGRRVLPVTVAAAAAAALGGALLVAALPGTAPTTPATPATATSSVRPVAQPSVTSTASSTSSAATRAPAPVLSAKERKAAAKKAAAKKSAKKAAAAKKAAKKRGKGARGD